MDWVEGNIFIVLVLVGSHALVEVKCLHKVHKSGKSLEEAVQTEKGLCLEIRGDKIQLKRNHNYYYQVNYNNLLIYSLLRPPGGLAPLNLRHF